MNTIESRTQVANSGEEDFDDCYVPQLCCRDLNTLHDEAWAALHAKSDEEHAAEQEEMMRVLAALEAEEKADTTH